MKHFLLEKEPDKNGVIKLSGGDYRYLVKVLRLAEGEQFPVVLPDGTPAVTKIMSVDNGMLTGKISPPEPSAAESYADLAVGAMPSVILFQALPKGEKMDLIVRQAAEGGIAEIVPFVSERSVSKANNPQAKLQRWERIVREARQQSGSPVPTTVRTPLTLEQIMDFWEEIKKFGTKGILFHHEPLEQASLHSYLDTVPPIVVLAVGPEGGFSGTEVNRFMEAGFKPFTIKGAVLRTETAALYCAAAIRIILLERNSWSLMRTE